MVSWISAPLMALGEMWEKLNQRQMITTVIWETIMVALRVEWMEDDGGLHSQVGCEE